jgi:hypothetical protein
MNNQKIKSVTMLLILGLLAFSRATHAVVPAPGGAYGPPSYGKGNTAEGQNALFSLGTGQYNSAIGWVSLYNLINGSFNTGVGAGALFNTTGDNNTATGAAALFFNGNGTKNTADGAFALLNNTNGIENTATGFQALLSNSTGSDNTANGVAALANNMDGHDNTATGAAALPANDHGNDNTANGSGALINNTSGSGNTAIGRSALAYNQTGSFNTASGFSALIHNSASANTAYGMQALFGNTNGSNNVAVGVNALSNSIDGSGNVAVGAGAGGNFTSASNVVCIGALAGTNHNSGDNDLYLGNPGVDTESGTVRLGTGDGVHTRMFLAGVRNVTTGQANAIPVLIDGAGQLGTASSSRRFKHDIKPMETTSESILALKPVTFHYKSDKTNTQQFGLIAEEVAEVNPNLVVRDEKGEIYTVRYDAVNAMLLNEFLKEHRNVEAQQALISELRKEMELLTAQQREQATQIQKVSARIEKGELAKSEFAVADAHGE